MDCCFNVSTWKVSDEDARRFNRIAKSICGPGAGFRQIEDPPNNDPKTYRNWFYIPNYGPPFDHHNAVAILKACGLLHEVKK